MEVTFAKRLEKERVEHGLTYLGLAEEANVSRTTLYRLTSGTRVPQYYAFIRLADALDSSLDYLAGRVKKNVPPSTTADVRQLCRYFSELSPSDRAVVLTQVQVLALRDQG